jgi:hypothetical protein
MEITSLILRIRVLDFWHIVIWRLIEEGGLLFENEENDGLGIMLEKIVQM